MNNLSKATYNYLNSKLNLDKVIGAELDNISDFGWEKASIDFDIEMSPEEELENECPMAIIEEIEMLKDETNSKVKSFLMKIQLDRLQRAKKAERFNI